MAENDVGGIGVKFTAEAAQLQQELQKLEQRLKQFDSAHGQKKIRLQAELVMPGNRALQDFRRDLEKGFGSQGSAGRVKARIELIPPTASEIKALTGKIGDVKVKVVGNFEWGTKPPKTVTVKVVEEGSGRPVAGGRSTVTQTQAVAQAASGGRSTRAAAPKKTTVAPGGPRVGNAELFADYKDNGALLSDYLDSYRKGGSRVWMGKARDELIRRGMTRDQIVAIEQGAKRPTGGARGLTGGMTGAFGQGAPAVRHWSQGPVSSVPAGPTIAAMGRRGEFPMPMRSIYNPYPAKGAPEPPAWKAGDLGRAPQLTEAALTRRLRQIVKTLSPEAMQAGTGWYQKAGEIAQGIGAKSGLGRSQISGVTAAFSQNAGWSENVRNAQDFFEAFRRGARTVAEVEAHVANIRKDLSFNALGLTGRTQQALNVAMGPADAEKTLGGPKGTANPKIRAFHRALMGDPTSFTVDRHMALMMSGGTIGSEQRMHTPFQRAGQRVAGEMGVSAADLQAMVWTNALGPKFAGADPYLQSRAGGPRGMADPYADWRLREQRASMRDASQTKGLAGDARESAIRDRNIRAEQKRFEEMTPEDIAARNADLARILGTGGSRGFTGSPFGAGHSRSGSPAAVGGTGDIQRWLEDQGRQTTQMTEAGRRLQADWGGFSMDPRTGQFMEPEPGRRQGPWLSSVGRTHLIPKEAAQDPYAMRAAIEALRADPVNARILRNPNAVIGGFNSPERPGLDLDVSLRDETAQAAMRRQIARGPESRGAYNVATGTGLFGPENAYGVPATRIPGLGQPRNLSTGRFASNRDLAAAMATPLARPTTAGADLDVPTFLRQQGAAIADAIHQRAAVPTAAEPNLQEVLNPPEAPPAGSPDDEIGRPSVSARALARAGLDPSGRPVTAAEGSPQARVQELLKSSRQAVQLAQGTGQVRAVGTTTGGLFANLLGGKAGRELVARDLTTLRHALEDFTKEGSDAYEAFERVSTAQTRFNQATLTGKGNTQALAKELQQAQQAAQPYAETVEAIGGRIQQLQGQISPLKQATIGFASSIAGTIVGLGIFNAVSAGIEGIGNALKEPSDRLLGFRRIGEQTGLALGQATRQMHGFSEGAVAATAAQSGLGDTVIGQIRPLLQQRAAVEAGNTAFREQLDLIRSAGFFERNPGAGITQTTGGLFGTPIGGQQPFLEQLLQSGSPVGGPLESRAGRVGINAAAGAATGAALGTLIPIPGLGTVTGAIAGGLIGGASGLLQTADQPESVTLGARARSGDLTEDEQQRLDEFGAALATINDGLEKANPKLKDTAHFVELLGNTGPAANEAVAATQKLLSEIPGITKDQLQAAKDLRFALIDPKTGTAARVAPQGLQRVLTEALRGVSLPSRQEAAFQTARGLTASLDLNQQQGRLQRETLIPGQSFLRQLFAGRAPTGRQVNIGDPLRQGTASLPPEILNRPGIDTSQLTEGLSQVETQANAGRTALVGMIKTADNLNQRAGISSNLLGSFNELTEAAGRTAATIRGISQASAWMQVNLQVKQINEQIFVMSRSLADAQSFLSGTGSGELGLLQNRARSLDIAQAEVGFRQQSLALANQELGITATTLQLQQRQRQINFQRAIAGFVTPGQTPEEIAARQEEARLEANFAQRQQDIGVRQLDNQREGVDLQRESLGISREQFAIQQAMIQVSAERAVGDLARGIALLQEQAQVTVQLQVNSDAIEAYQAVLEEQRAQIEEVIQEAYSVQQQVMSNAAALAAQYGGRITEWNNILIRALADYVGRAAATIAGFNEQIAGQYAPDFGVGTGGGPRPEGGGSTEATGFYGSVSGKTRMTVGEAGPETIAILRNPRNMTWQGSGGGGGGGVNINIMVSGNNVGSQQDADELAATIARKVEETMSRRSSLLGLRSN